ncbi:MAG: glycosyltransferase family 2 protein [Lachnospiraceae bacterium]|nr:glycosyltransferase family 2 protein [Lachnospiraceae bacterium]
MENKKVLMIIPAYNEQDNIIRVVEKIKKNYPQYDYIIVNDGSIDHTSRRCHKKGYNIIDLPINLGLAGAFQTGLKYAYFHGYEYAIQFDADGQHKPEYINAMFEKMQQGYDIIIGSRFVDKKKEISLRMLGSVVLSLAIWLTTGKRVTDPTSGMRMFNRDMIREFALSINYGPEPDTISYLLKQGANVAEVQVEMEERISGESYLNMSTAVLYMIRMLISIFFIQNFRKRDGRFREKRNLAIKDDVREENHV